MNKKKTENKKKKIQWVTQEPKLIYLYTRDDGETECVSEDGLVCENHAGE